MLHWNSGKGGVDGKKRQSCGGSAVQMVRTNGRFWTGSDVRNFQFWNFLVWPVPLAQSQVH